MVRLRGLGVVGVFLAMVTIVNAQEDVPELVTDRPDLTESASTVPAGWWQFEFGLTRERDRDAEEELRRLAVLGILVRAGVSRTVEARFAGGYVHQQVRGTGARTSERGVEAVMAGAKARVADGVALLGHLYFPVGHPALARRTLTPEVVLAVERDLGGDFGVAANIGGEWPQPGPLAFGTLTLGYDPTRRVGVFVELFGAAGRDVSPLTQLEGGMTYLLAGNLQLDLSGGAGVFDADPAWYFGAGISVRFPR